MKFKSFQEIVDLSRNEVAVQDDCVLPDDAYTFLPTYCTTPSCACTCTILQAFSKSRGYLGAFVYPFDGGAVHLQPKAKQSSLAPRLLEVLRSIGPGLAGEWERQAMRMKSVEPPPSRSTVTAQEGPVRAPRQFRRRARRTTKRAEASQ